MKDILKEKEMTTLQEAREQIAQQNGHASWNLCVWRENLTNILLLDEQAAELYAHSKTREFKLLVREYLYTHSKTREFKLLVREYFQAKSRAQHTIPYDEYKLLFEQFNALEKRILTELEEFTPSTEQEALEDYLKRNKDKHEFRLVINSDGKGYIHAFGQDSETLDFQL